MKPPMDDPQVMETSQTEEPKRTRSGISRIIVDVLETILISVVLFLGINALTARIRVDGFSMEPSLHTGEFILVNKLAYRLGSPQRGDVIVFHPPAEPDQEYIKRVIGLPGDKVVIADRKVSVNGQTLEEPYILQPPKYKGSWEVPPGQYFVLGDNRNNSSDSHNWGGVPVQNIIGKALFVYWPTSEWGLVEHTYGQPAIP
jgi:signal peptidase I